MSYHEAKEALDSLYEIFFRDFFLQHVDTKTEIEKFTENEIKRMEKMGYLEEKQVKEGEIPVTEKYKRVLALVDALSEFSPELFGRHIKGDVGMTFLELNDRYPPTRNGELYDFIKNPDFLKVFGEKLKQYLE
jgi:hypothetical protein